MINPAHSKASPTIAPLRPAHSQHVLDAGFQLAAQFADLRQRWSLCMICHQAQN
jgi:hypothetical protein